MARSNAKSSRSQSPPPPKKKTFTMALWPFEAFTKQQYPEMHERFGAPAALQAVPVKRPTAYLLPISSSTCLLSVYWIESSLCKCASVDHGKAHLTYGTSPWAVKSAANTLGSRHPAAFHQSRRRKVLAPETALRTCANRSTNRF